MTKQGFNTRLIHTPFPEADPYGSLQMPVYGTVSFEQESAEKLEMAFKGQIQKHLYSRSSNPTIQYFEKRILEITGGKYAVAVSSGMAAVSNVIMALTQSGDNFIVSPSLFGNTYALFESTFKRLGILPRFANFKNPETLEKLIDSKTRFIFFESLTNPMLEVFDIKSIAQFSKKHNIPIIVDTTLTPPHVFEAGKNGVHIEIASCTKYFSGGATALGGIIVDHGTYNWQTYPVFKEDVMKNKDFNLNIKLRREIFRNLGACISPQSAYMLGLGLETLTLRAEKSNFNANKLAIFLLSHPAVKKVHYPGLPNSPYHQAVNQYFNGFSGCIVSFEMASEGDCFKFINRLKIFRKATNICDNKSLAIHPRSTIYSEFSEEILQKINVPATLVRLSAGIEEAEDLIEDIKQALE